MAKREAGTIFISLQLATNELRAGIRTLDKEFAKIGQSAQRAGQRMSLAFTVPLAGFGAAAVREFAKFDKAMTDSVAFMGKVDQAMRDKLEKRAGEVAKKLGMDSTDIAKGYQALGQAGFGAAQSLEAIGKVAEFASASQTSLEQSTETLVQIQTALGLASKDPIENMKGLARVSDVLTKTSLTTTTSISDLSQALGSQLAGTLRANGINIEEAAAALGVLGQQGIKGAKAGTALGIVIRELGIDFLKNTKAFQSLGIEIFKQDGSYRNIITILNDVDVALRGMSDAQRIAAIASLGFTKKNNQFVQMFLGMNEALKDYTKINYEAAGATEAVAKAQSEAFERQMQMQIERIKEVQRIIGKDLRESVLSVMKFLADLAEAFGRLDPGTRKFALGLAAVVAALGPLMFFIGTIASGFSALLGFMGGLIGMFQKLGDKTTFLGKAFELLWKGISRVFGLITAGVAVLVATFGAIPVAIAAALTAAVAIGVYFWDDIKSAAQNFISWFSATFPDLSIVLQAVWIMITEEATRTWNQLTQLATDFWEWFKGLGDGLVMIANAAWQGIKDGAAFLWTGIQSGIQTFLTWFSQNFPAVSNIAGQVWDKMKETAQAACDVIKRVIEATADTIRSIFQALVDAKDWVVGKSHEIVDAAAKREAATATQKQADAAFELIKYLHGLDDIQKKNTQTTQEQSKAIPGLKERLEELVKETEKSATASGQQKKGLDEVLAGLKETEKGADKAADAMKELNKQLASSTMKETGEILETQIDEAIKNLDTTAFKDLTEKLRDSIKLGTAEGLKDLVEKAGKANEQAAKAIVDQIGSAKANAKIEESTEKLTKEQIENEKKVNEERKRQLEDAASYWRDVFTQASSGGLTDFKSQLKELVIGFAAQLAAALTGGFEGGMKSVGDIGAVIANGLVSAFGGTGSATGTTGAGGGGSNVAGTVAGAASLFGGSGGSVIAPEGAIGQNADGTFMMPDGTSQAGTTSATSANAAAGYVQAGAMVIGSAMSASDTDQANQDNSGTGAAIGAAAGAVIGTMIFPGIGTVIGAAIGQIGGGMVGGLFEWGPQNPETQARHAFANFIEEGFAKLKQVSFFDAQGTLKNFRGEDLNFLEGPSNKFNNPGWADEMKKMGDSARTTFLGLGEAMEEVLGLTEDVGGQIGFLLAENLGGNIDNARLLVQQLGLDMEDMINKLVEAGATGEMSWHQVEVSIQGVTEAFKPGLVAVGDIKGAFQELIDSGGRGMAAIKAVKDIAVEAMEAGAKTLDDLKRRLLEQGVDPAQVDALMTALQQRGITTLEQLAEVSNRVGGGIVADIESASTTMAATWAEMTAQLEDVTKKLEALPTEIQSNITLNVSANMTDDARAVIESGNAPGLDIPASTKKFAKGGVLKTPTFFNRNLGLAGEAGPEFLMPAQMMPDGSLGVRAIGNSRGNERGGTVIYVNAPNAAPGMENKIANAIKRMGDQTIAQAVDIMERRQSRGGRF